jgi:uncharacterized protein
VTVPRTAAEWIRALGLSPHPEGGHYRETYRAATMTAPAGFPGPRALSTAINFLLERDEVSALHRLRADELWHFHAGSTVRVVELTAGDVLREHRLGLDLEAGERPQLVIPGGSWFGARVDSGGSFALMSCTVAPGFDFADFELADRATLRSRHPRHVESLEAFLRRP